MHYIRYANEDDIDNCNRIARQWPDELAFVSKLSMRTGIETKSMFVACLDNQVVGFVIFYRRKDGWQTIYDLAVDNAHTGKGIGRALLYAVPCPVRLKTTIDNERANRFYQNAGMALVRTEEGRKRSLNVYEMRILSILCAGNNTRFPEVARASGWAYGTRHDMTPRDWPYMVDIKWNDYDWQDYMHKICEWKPLQAMVPDYEHPSQRRMIYQQIRDLRNAGVLRIKVCPKFDGAVAHVPSWCVIAVSIPSKYAGYVSPLHELRGRKMHMLGGSPVAQRDWMLKLNAVGQVISMDGNSHTKTARRGGYWQGGVWKFDREAFDYYEICKLSGVNIRKMLNEIADYKQLRLVI